MVFTLPAELSELALANPRLLYNHLFQAASATLRDVAANPKRLGADGRAGGAAHLGAESAPSSAPALCGDWWGSLVRWSRGRRRVAPLGVVPARLLLAGAGAEPGVSGQIPGVAPRAFDQGQLTFPRRLGLLAEAGGFAELVRLLYKKDWVVYSKAPFGGAAQVLKYLARYTHRVAISNNRLLKLEEGQVTFRYKDYAADRQQKTMTLSAEEFLRRFVQHVLPRGFVKIRHYGLLANRQRADKLHDCRRLLLPLTAVVNASGMPTKVADEKAEIAPAQRPVCPRCGGSRLERVELCNAASADRGENSS